VTCQELVEFLMKYLDGELSAGEQSRFERHLEECPDCVAYVATYQETVRLGKAVCTCGETIPWDVPYQLVQAVMAARARAWA
jgi:anti-sigma factor RsiW